MHRRAEILGPVQKARIGRLPVAAGAAELLVVRVERGRRVGMQHPAHVGLVDAHPERHRRGDDAGGAVEECRHRPRRSFGVSPA